MRIILPLTLRRSLLTSLTVCSLSAASLSFSATGADFIVDASQSSNPGGNVYRTLAELATSDVLSAGDTVILNNDDATLTTGLAVPVNFRSNDPETQRTVDLSGLGNAPLFNLAPGGSSLNMESIVWANAAATIFSYYDRNSRGAVSLTLAGNAVYTGSLGLYVANNSGAGSCYGGAISLYNFHACALTVGDHAIFSSNHTTYSGASGGAICVLSSSDTATLAMGDDIVFAGNYATKDGGAVRIYGDEGSFVTMGGGAVFTGNYVSTGTYAKGGAIFITTNYGENSLTLGANARFTGNYLSGRYCRGGRLP